MQHARMTSCEIAVGHTSITRVSGGTPARTGEAASPFRLVHQCHGRTHLIRQYFHPWADLDERLQRYKDVPHSSILAGTSRPDLGKPDNWGDDPAKRTGL